MSFARRVPCADLFSRQLKDELLNIRPPLKDLEFVERGA